MTDRIALDDMTSDQLDELYRRIETLEHVAAGNKRHVQLIVPELERTEATVARIRAAVHIADEQDVTDWQRGYRACAERALTALGQPVPAATEPPAWTPPPPGDTREQLPNHLLALIEPAPYLSTACQTADLLACAACFPGSGVPRPQYDELRAHAERLHQRCRLNNKFTGQLCVCGCHAVQETTTPS